jgi:hypothetical protein
LDNEELGRDELADTFALAVVLRTGGVAFGPGLVRDIEPFAVSVVVPTPLVGLVGGGVDRPCACPCPWDDAEESDVELEILAGRRGGRVGGEVVVIYRIRRWETIHENCGKDGSGRRLQLARTKKVAGSKIF